MDLCISTLIYSVKASFISSIIDLQYIVMFPIFKAELHNVVARLSGKSFDVENKTSDSKILSIVKGILVGLKSQQSIIANLVCVPSSQYAPCLFCKAIFLSRC